MPWLGFNCPVISFMNVHFPAPFGPSRPVMPGGMATVTSFSPLTCPYHFDRCSACTRAAATEGRTGRCRRLAGSRVPTPDARGSQLT